MGRTPERLTVEQTRIDSKRTFGVEIEIISELCPYDVAEALREAGIDCYDEHYNHDTRDYWKIVEDCSINCDYGEETMELVSPPLRGREGLRQLKIVCEVLDSLDCYTNSTCGLHVHHDAHDFDMDAWRILIKNVLKYEDTMDALHPWDRRGENWACRSLADGASLPRLFARLDSSEDIWQMGRIWNSRYLKVNIESFNTHGTVEFRQHEGTISFKEIAAWVSLTQGLVERAVCGKPMRMRGTTRPFESLMLTANACAAVRRHYLAKYCP